MVRIYCIIQVIRSACGKIHTCFVSDKQFNPIAVRMAKTLLNRNGLIQMIRLDKSTGQIWFKSYHNHICCQFPDSFDRHLSPQPSYVPTIDEGGGTSFSV